MTLKYFLFSVAVFFGLTICRSQTHDSYKVKNKTSTQLQMIHFSGGAEFKKMIVFESAPAELLYKGVNEWVILTFNTSSDIVKDRFDGEGLHGEGIQSGFILYSFPRIKASLKYAFYIDTEDNKLCFTMNAMEIWTEMNDKDPIEIYVYKPDGSEVHDKQSRKVKEYATRTANLLMGSLETFLAENNFIRKWN